MTDSPEIDVRALREHLGWSQEQMAEALSCDRSSVSNYERGIHPVTGLRRRALADLAAQSGFAPSHLVNAGVPACGSFQ